MARAKASGGHKKAPGRVRIGAGSLRGSVLAVPEHPGLRPTPGRVRETLFNWLRAVLPGARCLDLFAGSGALGVEALSRGAAWATFVERDAGLAEALRSNLGRLGREDAEVECADAGAWLAGAIRQPFDVVFLDPPFGADLWNRAVADLEASGLLAAPAWIHVEAPAGKGVVVPSGWRMHREGRAGDVHHVLYRRDGAHPLS